MKLSKQTFNEWYTLLKQLDNGYHLSIHDMHELIRLNHEVLEIANNVHNSNMLNNLQNITL